MTSEYKFKSGATLDVCVPVDWTTIDFERVERETLADNPSAVGFLLCVDKSVVLALNADFLMKFSDDDRQKVRNENLNPDWGYEAVRVQRVRNHGYFQCPHIIILDGDAHIAVDWRYMPVPRKAVPQVLHEIEKAKAYRRKPLTFKVEVIV